MPAIPRFFLAVLFVPLAACAATIPSTATFEPSAWQAVEALQPGTRVEVAYVTGEPRQLRYSFSGEIESVDAAWLVMRTETGLQRLLPERVQQVSRVTRVTRGGDRIRLGILFGAAIGVALTAVYPGEKEGRLYAMPLFAGVGALIGGASGALAGAEARQLIYRRR